jgi:hypothetical protein
VAAAAAPQTEKAYHMFLRQHPPAKGKVLYYGGTVSANVNTVAVLWSAQVAKAISSKIGPFVKALPNSTYLDQLSQYSTVGLNGVDGDPGSNQTIARGTYGGRFKIVPKNKSKNLTDANIQAEIMGQIAAGKLPAATLNTLYMIYFPADITITLDGLTSCSSFGAYHEAVSSTITPTNIFYAVMPDCGGGFGNITFASSHEFAEAVTDNIPTPGSSPARPQAWNTSDGYEIGDLCEQYGTTMTVGKIVYQVQEVWSNITNACATGTFKSP